MKRSSRTNALLFVMVLILGIAVFAEIEHEKTLRPSALTPIDITAVNQLTVNCVGCSTRHFEKKNGQWWMREPYALAADVSAINRLLAITQTPVRSLHSSNELDVKKLGLDPAQASLDIDALNKGKMQRIHLAMGATNAIHNDRYVQIENTIALIPDHFSAFLYATAESELDHGLVPPGAIVNAVHINGVAHNEIGPTWQTLKAQQINKSSVDIVQPSNARVITLSLSDAAALEYHLFRCGQVYIARRFAPDLDYVLDETQVQALLGAID